MLTTYLACLVFGGTLVAFSVLGGAFDDADVDGDAGGDMDVDADADIDGDIDGNTNGDGGDAIADVSLGWLPLTSMRFWTFLLAFGGLTGALLTFVSQLSQLIIGPLALAVGYACGIGITRSLRALSSDDVGRGLREEDFVGASGSVLLPIGPARVGQVRVEIGGRYIDRSATTEDAEALGSGAAVLVYGVHDDGSLRVTRAAALPAGD